MIGFNDSPFLRLDHYTPIFNDDGSVLLIPKAGLKKDSYRSDSAESSTEDYKADAESALRQDRLQAAVKQYLKDMENAYKN